jgi:phytoene dehydrogenase-like protein
MPDYDALVVGAGHNALVCAGYLARAGYKVGVLERRPVVGGAVVTEEHVPGFRFDLGGSAHILIHGTPIVQDLALERYGLEYIDCDPLFFAPFPDGSHLFIWRDIDRTCESIAQISPEDADNYRRFIAQWTPVAEAMLATFNGPSTPFNLFRKLIVGSGFGRAWPERLSDIIRGYGPLLRRVFKTPQVQALVGWMAAQSGPPPGEPFSAPFALWHPLYHQGGVRRPRGGSGMLTQALARRRIAGAATHRAANDLPGPGLPGTRLRRFPGRATLTGPRPDRDDVFGSGPEPRAAGPAYAVPVGPVLPLRAGEW